LGSVGRDNSVPVARWRRRRRRRTIRLTIRSSTAIAEGLDAAVLVPVEDLVARFPRNPELGAQRRHLLTLKQAGDESEPLVHDVTLLPRHAPSSEGAKVSPMCPEYGVTYLSGRTRKFADFDRKKYLRAKLPRKK
jgi:hypothetical protein